DVVVRKEVQVDAEREQRGGPQRRGKGGGKAKEPPSPNEGGADGGGHETGEQGRAGGLEHGWLGIKPGTDARLEDVHHPADRGKREDRVRVFERFEPERQERDLDAERDDDQKVVSAERCTGWIEEVSADQERHHDAAE